MNKRPQQSGNGMFVQVQTSVEIQSSVSISYRCSEKEYERLFIREPEVKARAGKMAYVRPEYHERIMRITRVIGHDRLTLSAYIDHVDRKSTRLNSSHTLASRMPSSA